MNVRNFIFFGECAHFHFLWHIVNDKYHRMNLLRSLLGQNWTFIGNMAETKIIVWMNSHIIALEQRASLTSRGDGEGSSRTWSRRFRRNRKSASRWNTLACCQSYSRSPRLERFYRPRYIPPKLVSALQFLTDSRSMLRTREKCERMVEGDAKLARSGHGGLMSQNSPRVGSRAGGERDWTLSVQMTRLDSRQGLGAAGKPVAFEKLERVWSVLSQIRPVINGHYELLEKLGNSHLVYWVHQRLKLFFLEIVIECSETTLRKSRYRDRRKKSHNFLKRSKLFSKIPSSWRRTERIISKIEIEGSFTHFLLFSDERNFLCNDQKSTFWDSSHVHNTISWNREFLSSWEECFPISFHKYWSPN
jgi:hypothetical protein